MNLKRTEYSNSLNQLLTISCILAGFAFSGLISLPGMEQEMFRKIVDYFDGNFEIGFYLSFYALFFSTICFLSTIMTVLVYKVNNFFVPIKKLKNIYLIANLTFAVAISALMISVISFGIPSIIGASLALFFGICVGGSFIWENLLPRQIAKRQEQIKKEELDENKNNDIEKDSSEEKEQKSEAEKPEKE